MGRCAGRRCPARNLGPADLKSAATPGTILVRGGGYPPPRTRSLGPRDAAGFTVVELVVVITLLGVLAGVAGPRFFSLQGFSSSQFFDETITALRYGQKLAVASGCEVQVSFTASSYTLNLQNACSGSTYTQAVLNPGTGTSTYTGTAPTGTSVSSDVSPLLFDALGRATNSGGTVSNATVTVGARSISVVGETGLVHEP